MKVKRFIAKVMLEFQQLYIDNLQDVVGVSDEVIRKQARLNSKRHELDLTDESEIVHEKFVQ